MRIAFILKGSFECLPPMLPRIINMADKVDSIDILCSSISSKNKKILEEKNINCIETKHKEYLFGKQSRLLDWLGFRKACKKYIKINGHNIDALYICSADTALCLIGIFEKYKYVFQSNELYDRFPLYKNGLKKVIQNAMVFVVPEYTRANICSYWYKLDEMPMVIPNIPYIISRERNQTITSKHAADALKELSGKKIILYQGHISAGDRSLNSIAMALCKLNDESLVLVLMGRNFNNSVEKIKSIYKNTIHISFVTPPYHLEITSHAHIAILSYDRVSLNNIFCAPNKLYEYSCFGIPMLANSIPGHENTISAFQMGVCAEYSDIDSIVKAFEKINNNYDFYRENSKKFFEYKSISDYMDELVEKIKGRV